MRGAVQQYTQSHRKSRVLSLGGDTQWLGTLGEYSRTEQNRHTQDKGLSKEEVSNTQIYEPDIDRKVNKHRDMTDCGNKMNYRGRQTM